MATQAGAAKLGERRQGPPGERTRERILDGALRAIARHGLTKLGMSDVSDSAGVSRGTLYRYFPSKEDLLDSLAEHEGRRFQKRVADAVREASGGEERLRVLLEHVARYGRDQPAIRRIVESEPAFVLAYIREHFAELREIPRRRMVPLLRETEPVRLGAVSGDQLVDWLTRLMITAVLFPDPHPQEMARGLTAVYRHLSGAAAATNTVTRRRHGRRATPRTKGDKRKGAR